MVTCDKTGDPRRDEAFSLWEESGRNREVKRHFRRIRRNKQRLFANGK
ncbi:hypothetical protein KQR57_17565 [Bacillus inaquosorum]|nr:hypothetical protein [Bacillus inaquosorum]